MSLVNINDEEVVVVIMDFLKRKGYFKALTALENESKISMNSYGKEVSYLRRLILDGQWEDAENFLVPVKAELGGDLERIQFLFHRQRFLELIYKQSLGNAVMELVDEVKKFEGKCSEREFQQLCYCLTLKNLNDHPDFRTWTPHRGRAICFDDVLPYIESVYGANQPFPNNGGADSDGVHSLYPSAPANNSKVGVGEMEPMRLLALIKQALLYQVDMAYRSSSKSGSPPEKVKLSIFKDFKLEAGNGTYGRSRGVSTPRTAPRGRKHLQSRHNFAPSSPNPSPSYHSNESPDMSFRSEAKRTNRHYDKVYAPPEDSRDGRMRRRRKHRKDADENVESDDDDEAKRHRGREPKRQQQKGVIQKKAKLQLGSSGSSAAPTAISFHPSGDFVCAGTRDGKVNIVKRTRTMIPATKSGKRSPPSTSIRPVCRMTTHLGAVTCMDWCKRNPNLIATGGRDKCVRLSCLQSSSSIFNVGDASSFSPDVRSMEVGYHSGVVTGIGFRMKHPHIVSSGADGIINVWECTRAVKTIVEEDDEEEYGVTKGRRRSGIQLGDACYRRFNHQGGVTSLSLSKANDNILASSSISGGVALWDIRNGRDGSCSSKFNLGYPIDSISLSHHGGKLACGSSNGSFLCIYDLRGTEIIWKRRSNSLGLAWSPDGQLLASTTEKGIEVFDATCGKLVARYASNGIDKRPAPIIWHPHSKSKEFASCSPGENSIMLFELSSGNS